MVKTKVRLFNDIQPEEAEVKDGGYDILDGGVSPANLLEKPNEKDKDAITEKEFSVLKEIGTI